MKQRSKGLPDGVIRGLLWGTVALGLLLAWLDANPIHIDSEEELVPGNKLVLEAVSDVLLVVDYDNFPSEPESFKEIDFSLAWLNSLQQEVGPVALTDADDLPDVELSDYRVVIITRSTSASDSWLPKLRGFVERGGTLVLEMPNGVIRKAFSADGLGGERDPQRITTARGLSEELQAALGDLPLETRLIGSSGPLEGSETLMTIDGIPVVYKKQFGVGKVITFDFDYGMLLTSIQQGKPNEEFRVRDKVGSDEIEAADLTLDESLVDSDLPVADVLERFVVYGVIGSSYPVAGFWPFIDGMDGAFVVTHDEHGMGDDAAWMAEYEHDFSGSSSFFIRSPGAMTTEGVATLATLGVDVALEWDRALGEGGAYKRIGVWGVEPVQKALTLVEQAEWLKELMDDRPLVTVRTRDHLWGRDWTAPFRAMAAAELLADSSYAPPPGVIGYPFGTGLPFMPLDQTGLAFNLLEFPNVLLATGSEDEREALSRLLKGSQDSYHQALGVSFAPSAFIDAPSALLYRNWRDGYRLAAEHGHWITSVRNLYRFSRARHKSELRSRRVETTLNGNEAMLLRLETLALESGMFCSVPKTIGEREFVEARRGVNRAQGNDLLREKITTNEVDLMGYPRILVPLSKGFNAIDVVYE